MIGLFTLLADSRITLSNVIHNVLMRKIIYIHIVFNCLLRQPRIPVRFPQVYNSVSLMEKHSLRALKSVR